MINLDLYIITNGNPTQQRNKIISTKLPKNVYIEKEYYANEFIKKPNPISLQKLSKNLDFYNPIYIGDSQTR